VATRESRMPFLRAAARTTTAPPAARAASAGTVAVSLGLNTRAFFPGCDPSYA
jgi:hypothetical protein